jgi:hypothetical protein
LLLGENEEGFFDCGLLEAQAFAQDDRVSHWLLVVKRE